MKYHRRIFFTDKQKSEIWDRWRRGEAVSSITFGHPIAVLIKKKMIAERTAAAGTVMIHAAMIVMK